MGLFRRRVSSRDIGVGVQLVDVIEGVRILRELLLENLPAASRGRRRHDELCVLFFTARCRDEDVGENRTVRENQTFFGIVDDIVHDAVVRSNVLRRHIHEE